MKRWTLLLILFITAVALTACGSNSSNQSTNQNSDEPKSQDEAKGDNQIEVELNKLNNGKKESVGTVTLQQVSGGVKISIEGKDIPKGAHGFHIHKNGKCKAPDFKSAGGHFNPGDTKHGFDVTNGSHAGDLPNIVVDKDGTVNMSYLNKKVTLEKGKDNSLLSNGGTAIVIHQGKDDGKSQPSGDAGDRFACGVISK